MSYFRHLIPALILLSVAVASCRKTGPDSFRRDGMEYSALGDKCRSRMELGDALKYYKMARDCYATAGDSSSLWRTSVDIARVYSKVGEWAYADSLLNSILENPAVEDGTKARALFGLADIKVNHSDSIDAEAALDCFNRAVEVYQGEPEVSDYYTYGYIIALLGDPEGGLTLIDHYLKNDSSASTSADYYKYKIYSLLNDEANARVNYGKYASRYTMDMARVSMDRMDERILLLKQQRKITLLITTIILLLLLGIVGVLVWLNKKKKADLNRKVEDLISLTEELKKVHSSNEALVGRIQNKYKELFQAQFKVLEKLYVAFNTPDAVRKDAVFGEAGQILKSINADNEKQHQFEQYLDRELDGIMHKFRQDYPDLKESDYKLFSYCITGFSARTIASLTGFTIGSVYTKKNALRSMISASASAHKELFFQYL